MRVKTVKRGKRTAGRVHYCPRCANDLVAGGEIDIFPPGVAFSWSAPREGACAITVSLNKRGRWGLLKNLKSVKSEKEVGPRDKVPQYHNTPKGTYLCGEPSMVVLSRDEVMGVLPESDWAHLADARGAVAERWLCFFIRNGHSAESHSEGAAWDYINALCEEDKRAHGTSALNVVRIQVLKTVLTWVVVVCFGEAGVLMVKQDNAEKKGQLFQCPARTTMSARNRAPPKARGKDKGAAKDRTRCMIAAINPTW